MVFFSALGIGLSFLFGCILLGIVGELYYLLWWKKRITINREIDDHYTSMTTSEISYTFCWKKPNSDTVNKTSSHQELAVTVRNSEAINGDDEQDLEQGYGEEGIESELMRLHNLCGHGPPRFLFTINEETKEDLESDDGKSMGDMSRKGSRTISLSDFIITPLSSPPIKAHLLDSYSQLGFNPLFESFSEAEFTRLRSSPPPKFKFLRDAEEKLMKRLMEEAEKKTLNNGGSIQDSVVNEEKDCSFFTFNGKNRARELHHQLPFCHSTPSSQVYPLASSPSTFTPFENHQAVQ